MGLVFEPELHRYTVDGVEVPSVTTILKEIGIIDTTYYTASGAATGKTKHQMLEVLDRGELDWTAVPDEWLWICEAWVRWLGDCEILAIEEPVCHEILGYAGTPDRVLLVDGEKTVVDIKSGGHERWHLLQCQMYAACVGATRCTVWYPRPTKQGYVMDHAGYDKEIPIAVMRVYGCLTR